ncbi:MAG TPA: EFR1 family ferrodoxin [Methanospirillum sp.]|nr:EFR1 family ferrodoxin [Methanospirillum sp.]
MNSVIYYFTGSGNSLAVAKKTAAAMGDCELVPIATRMETPGDIIPVTERVGIICPVYFSGLPDMVASFARRLRLTGVAYVFAIVTYGGGIGAISTLRQLDDILKEHSSRGLDAGFRVKMPANYIMLYQPPTGEKLDAILAQANGEIAQITDIVSQCQKQELAHSFVEQLLHPFIYSRFISKVHDDRGFTVSEQCTSCGICVAICPAGNIELVETKPVWKHRCERCCGCIHLCPVQAIQVGAKTEKRLRYRNPDITVAELKLRPEKKQ